MRSSVYKMEIALGELMGLVELAVEKDGLADEQHYEDFGVWATELVKAVMETRMTA